MAEKKAQIETKQADRKETEPHTTKANDSAAKPAEEVKAGKNTTTKKPKPAKSEGAAKASAAKQAKTPAKKQATGAAVKKDAPEKAAHPKGEAPHEQPAAETVEKVKGAFAQKMDEVKSTAAVIGHKIADVAKDANKKSEGFEDAVAVGLHEMKKDIHRMAVNIAEKTKE